MDEVKNEMKEDKCEYDTFKISKDIMKNLTNDSVSENIKKNFITAF